MSEPTILSRNYGKLFLIAAVSAVICVLAFSMSASGPHPRVGPGASSSSGSDFIGKLTAFLTAVTGVLSAIGKLRDNKVISAGGGAGGGGIGGGNGGTTQGAGGGSGALQPVYHRPRREEVVMGEVGEWLDIHLVEWDGGRWIRIDQYRKHRDQPPPTYL